MNRRMLQIMLFLPILAPLVGCRSGPAEYDFSERLREGETWVFEGKQTREFPVALPDGEKSRMNVEYFDGMTLTVLDVDAGRMRKARIKVSQSTVTPWTDLETGKMQFTPLHGRTLLVERTPAGTQVTGEGWQMPEPIASALAESFSERSRLFPRGAKKIGDRWELEGEQLRMAIAMFADSPQDPGSGRVGFEFKGIRRMATPSVGRVQLALLESDWEFGARAGGSLKKFKLRGVHHFRLDKGVPVYTRLEGAMGGGTLRSERWVRPADSSADGSATTTGSSKERLDETALATYTDHMEKAFTMLIPRGWIAEGGVLRPTGADAAGPRYRARLGFAFTRPDGRACLAHTPEQLFFSPGRKSSVPLSEGKLYRGMTVHRRLGPEAFIRKILIRGQRRKARDVEVLERTDMPGLVEIYRQDAAATADITFKGLALTVRYEEGGREFRERFCVVLRYVRVPHSGDTAWSNVLSLSTRAPEAGFERLEPLFATCFHSFRLNPDWVLREMRQRTRSEEDQPAAGDWSRLCKKFVERQRRVAARAAQAWLASGESLVDYADPRVGEPVRLPGGYAGVWSDGKGNYILTDDPLYNPQEDEQGRWKQIKVAPDHITDP